MILEQGSYLGPLHWERGVLATGPPGKFPGRNLEKEILRGKKQIKKRKSLAKEEGLSYYAGIRR